MYEKYKDLVRSRLSDYRFIHSMNVAEKARELARLYGVDEGKAYLAGILHDIMKEEKPEIQEKYIKAYGINLTELEKNNKQIYHQMSGAGYVKTELGIEDSDILNAIRFHTTGRADMTDFEMVIYIADLTSAERSYPDVDAMRREADRSLLDAMLYALRFVITDLASKEREIHPDTLFCYNWVVSELNKRK
ncbi:MAG: bis(5'-nucleosyl)-tetraphosphatase (symmetrical) YqeK [Eubacterium sp.]